MMMDLITYITGLLAPFFPQYATVSIVVGLVIVACTNVYFKYRYKRYDGRNPNKCPYCKGRCTPGPNIGPWQYRMETWHCQSCGAVYEFPLKRTGQGS